MRSPVRTWCGVGTQEAEGRDLRHRVIRALRSRGLGNAAVQLCGTVVSLVLARLLTPAEFGLMAMAAVVLGLMQIASREAIAAALIQRDEIDERAMTSAFWLGVAVSCGLVGLCWAVAAPVAALYGVPEVAWVLRLLSLQLVFDALGGVHRAWMRRDLEFRGLSRIDLAGILLGGGVGVVCAIAGAGVASLVAQALVTSVVGNLAAWWCRPWRPRLDWSREATSDLLRYARHVWASGGLNHLVRSLDDAVIGATAGAASLGAYSRAYQLMLLPLRTVSASVAEVMLPALSRLQDDRPMAGRVYLRFVRVIAFLAFPVVVGLFAVSDLFVHVVLGDPWAETIVLLRILGPLGITQSVLLTVGAVYRSQGRPDLELRVGLALKGVLVLGILIGLEWGVVGVACGYAIASLLNSYPCMWFAGRLIGVTPGDVARAVLAPLVFALAMGSVVLALRAALPVDTSEWVELAAVVAVGVVVYVGLALAWDPRAALELRELRRA